MAHARRFFKRPDSAILIGCISITVILALLSPQIWFSSFNIRNITSYTAILGTVAIGVALLILVREIDLSVGSVYGVAGIAFVTLEATLGVELSILGALLIAAAIGLVNGLLVVRFGLSSLIVTLGALFFYRGLIYVTTGGTVRSLGAQSEGQPLVQLFGGNWLLELENAFWWLVLIVAVFTYVLVRRPFGNHLLAIGGSLPSAQSRGVRVGAVKLAAFVVCSSLAGLAGVMTLSQEPRTNVKIGEGIELQAIAAAVIGGVLLTGGRGTAIGAALGAFFLIAVRTGILILRFPGDWYISIVGLCLIVAAMVNLRLQRTFAGVTTA